MDRTIKDRILSVFKFKKINANRASRLLGIPQRTLNRQVNEDGKVGMELVYSLLNTFKDISPAWLLLGHGEMVQDADALAAVEGSAPFFSNLPVSAGYKEAFDPAREKPTGFISMPGLSAQFYFPVSGTSMEPEIHSGDIIGVNRVESLRDVDPDKIYMIVTNESRMIKRCHSDENDDSIMWCVSPNYPSFKINKNDICALFHVVNRIERL
ncbi:MAG: helix-turn-helix transcriptional regulator [Bacteroidaceae bacterium]|nr:helix-turn-helix transcriptional regulator [Bacteroidales bacterium]MBO5263516.1 helix-turn-helix transcriptional regulator [Bacteroidaceae bacterium]MBQ8257865.1 helix-turn-helix transcriptional regulator [Bacteroidaceae bacterium]